MFLLSLLIIFVVIFLVYVHLKGTGATYREKIKNLFS